ncbi:MAG: hypothetical protein U1E73_06170 [Planctomycetota bacterium]
MSAEREAAEERLLEASLRSLLGRAPAAERRSTRSSMWLVAACVALGLGVVVASMCMQRGGDGGTNAPAQDPAPAPLPLPDEVQGDATTLPTLPADTQNLTARLVEPGDLALLRRFPQLRRLQLISDYRNRTKVLTGEADALAAFVGMPALEVLELHCDTALRPEQLLPLRKLPNLRTLAFSGESGHSEELGAALCALPALSDLRLFGTVADAAFLTALAPRPLQRLALNACPGLDGDAWRALGRLRQLDHLELTGLNGGTVGVAGKSGRLGQLDAAAFDALDALPRLRALLLDESEFDDTMLARLPARLERLDLGDRPMRSALVPQALRRLGNLRDLTFGCGLDPEPAIELLGALRLRRLDYRGKLLSPELLRAIADQPDLIELSLKVQQKKPIDYAVLARAPRLESLRILGAGTFSARFEHLPGIGELKPLRDCKALRRICFVNCGLDLGAIGKELGPGIELRAVEYL